MADFAWLPANRATPDDVEAVFATSGAHKCRCQGLKVPGWIWRDTTQEQRDVAQVEQTACGTPGPTSGLIGYVDGEPAGWVAVEPRENYPRIWSRKQPWMRMDPEREGIWSVTCFVVRTGWRKAGLTYELAAATVAYGQQVGAHVLEGYPKGRLRGRGLTHAAPPRGTSRGPAARSVLNGVTSVTLAASRARGTAVLDSTLARVRVLVEAPQPPLDDEAPPVAR